MSYPESPKMKMASDSEPFTFLEDPQQASPFFPQYQNMVSAKSFDLNVQITAKLRQDYPALTVTAIPKSNCDLLAYAQAGNAVAELDTSSDAVIRLRGYVAPWGEPGYLAEARQFAKYHYSWNNQYFIVFVVVHGQAIQYVLKEPDQWENPMSNSAAVDALVTATGQWQVGTDKIIYVHDGYWQKSEAMYQEVEKASWDKVILDPNMKKDITEVAKRFFDSKDIYDDYDVPWKRGIMFYGPAGNGKTISIKALMKTLQARNMPLLYVRSANSTYAIGRVFDFARRMSPCLLVLEDIDTIVTERTRSYFFNEVDGLQNNNGILMIATTNHLDRLDPGLSKRPSRFDRKYLFPNPNLAERLLYCKFWQNKLKTKRNIEFPDLLLEPMAKITDNFSFAYIQEAFVATLLVIARQHTEGSSSTIGDLQKYELWRVFEEQVKLLREEMDGKRVAQSSSRVVTSSQSQEVKYDWTYCSANPSPKKQLAPAVHSTSEEAVYDWHFAAANPSQEQKPASIEAKIEEPVYDWMCCAPHPTKTFQQASVTAPSKSGENIYDWMCCVPRPAKLASTAAAAQSPSKETSIVHKDWMFAAPRPTKKEHSSVRQSPPRNVEEVYDWLYATPRPAQGPVQTYGATKPYTGPIDMSQGTDDIYNWLYAAPCPRGPTVTKILPNRGRNASPKPVKVTKKASEFPSKTDIENQYIMMAGFGTNSNEDLKSSPPEKPSSPAPGVKAIGQDKEWSKWAYNPPTTPKQKVTPPAKPLPQNKDVELQYLLMAGIHGEERPVMKSELPESNEAQSDAEFDDDIVVVDKDEEVPVKPASFAGLPTTKSGVVDVNALLSAMAGIIPVQPEANAKTEKKSSQADPSANCDWMYAAPHASKK